jgi:hypothetical protein
MTDVSAPERALRDIVRELSSGGRAFALVGGLAVSIRAEVRFTRDVISPFPFRTTRTQKRSFASCLPRAIVRSPSSCTRS